MIDPEKCERIKGLLSMPEAFPSQSRGGRLQDAQYRESLLSELTGLGVSLKALASLSRSANTLFALIDTLKRS